MEPVQDIIADNCLQVDQRGALCIFIEKDDPSLLPTLLGLRAEGFLMCKYPSMTNDSCLACKLKDGNDELIPYIGAELFVEETHFKWYFDRLTPQEQGKVWKFDFSNVQHGHEWGNVGGETLSVPEWVQKMDGLPESVTIQRTIPDYKESQLDTGVARLSIGGCIQLQFRMKDMEPETDEAYNDPTIRFDLDDEGNPKEFTFKGSIAQYGNSHVTGAPYTGTMNQPFYQRARFGAINPFEFWTDYYLEGCEELLYWENGQIKSRPGKPMPDRYLCEWYDSYGLTDAWEVPTYTITCWRYMDHRLGMWRYVCIDVSPDLDFNSHGFHSETAKLKFNKLQLNSVAPAEDLDLHPLEYLKEQEA